jgi:hypothetical protein
VYLSLLYFTLNPEPLALCIPVSLMDRGADRSPCLNADTATNETKPKGIEAYLISMRTWIHF